MKTFAFVLLGVLAFGILMDDGCSRQMMERDRHRVEHFWRRNANGILTSVNLGWILPYEEPSIAMCYITGKELHTEDQRIVSAIVATTIFCLALSFSLIEGGVFGGLFGYGIYLLLQMAQVCMYGCCFYVAGSHWLFSNEAYSFIWTL